MLTGSHDDGYDWRACWSNGTYKWLQDDTDKAKCLTNLQYLQPNTVCISDDGSTCEPYGQGSKLLNAEVDPGEITAEESLTIQDALEDIVEVDQAIWSMYSGPGPGLYVDWEANGKAVAGSIRFRFGGDEQC